MVSRITSKSRNPLNLKTITEKRMVLWFGTGVPFARRNYSVTIGFNVISSQSTKTRAGFKAIKRFRPLS
jgi:hypothetical protein